jgi:hypothetical protein
MACGGEVVTLGHASQSASGAAGESGVSGASGATGAEGPRFETPVLVTELASDGDESDNPTLTADLLEIYFASGRDGGSGDVDVWMARRPSADAPFGAPEPVSVVNTDEFETSPAVSLDGLELWVGADRDGGLGEQDIWVSRRPSRDAAWSALSNAMELNSSEKDIPRQPAVGGRVMPLGSRRGGLEYYQTFLAERPSASEPFGTPRELVELEVDGQNTIDGFLTEDGLTLYFNRTPGAGESTGDLFLATRPDLTAPFGEGVPISDLNTSHDERDPWLSPDGQHLFFSSDRDGSLSIYEALAAAPAP